MKSNTIQVVLLLVFLYCASVYGAGQMFLNQINPVRQDTVTFKNDVYSYDAVLENTNTNSFQILKQYELNVQVPAISLSGHDFVAVTGSLGSSIVSNGDIAIVGNQDVTLEGHSVTLDSLEDFTISSAAKVAFNSELATSIQSSGVNVTTTGSQGVNITSAGDVDLSTRDEVYIASNRLSNTNAGDLNLDAKRGFLDVASGTRATFSSEDRTHINGVLGVNYASSGSITLTSEEAFFFGQAISNLAMGDSHFTYADTLVAAEEDIKVFADSASLTSLQSNIYLDAPGQYSNILLTGDSGISIQALSLISLVSQGEAGDILIVSNGFDLTTFTFNSVIQSDFVLGGNNTDNISLNSASTFLLKGYYLDAEVDDFILIQSKASSTFKAAGDIGFQTNSGTSTGANSLSFQSVNSDFYLYSDVGDGSVLLQTFNSDIIVTSNFNLVMDTYDFVSHFTGVQDILVGDLTMHAADDDINFLASTSIDFTTNDVSFDSYNVLWNATDSLSFTIQNSAYFFSEEATSFISNNTITFTSTADSQTFTSGNDISLENVDTSLDAQDTISYEVNSFSLKSGDSVFNAGGVLDIQLFESFHAVVTDEFSVESDSFTVNDAYAYVKSSNIALTGADSATLNMNTFTGKFGYLLVNATDTSTLNTNDRGDIHVDSGEDITLSSAQSILLTVGETTTANAEENLTFSGANIEAQIEEDFISNSNSGDQTFQTGDQIEIIATGDSQWTAGDSISVHAGSKYTLSVEGGIRINGGETTFSSGDEELLKIVAGISASFQTPAGNFDYEIAENSRALSFTATNQYNAESGDSVSYSSGSLDWNSAAMSAEASNSLTYSGSSAIINATNTGSFTSTDLSRFVSGDDDYINVDSAANLVFTSGGDFSILGEGDVKFEAVNFITLLADEDVEFASEFIVNVNAGDSLTILSTGEQNTEVDEGYINIVSFDSVNFDNANKFDTLIDSYNSAVASTVFRDFGIEANGQLTDGEGVVLSASKRGSSAHEYNSDGTLDILGEHCVDIRSFYTDQTVTPSGNINIVSDGHVFLHSETEGVTLISNGADANTNFAIVLEANAGVDIQSTKANVYVYGERGINSFSGNNYDVVGLRGVTLKSDGPNADIDFEAGEDTFASGARGLSLAAGTDAPFFAGDFTATAEAKLVVESANNILFRSFSTVSGPDAIRITTGSTVVESREGAGVYLSASGDANFVATDDTSIVAEDGLIRIDADIGDLTVANTGAITWSTTHGPIGIEGLGSGGSITFENQAFTSRTFLSTRIDALGSAEVTSGSTLDLYSPDETACVLVETFRAFDDVVLSADDSFTVTTDADSHVFGIEHIVIAGNNVDIAAENEVTFLQSELFEIGRDSTPIVRVIAGGVGATGVTVSARGDIEVNTGSTYTSQSTLDTTFNSRDINVTSSGVILLVAEGSTPANTDLKITSLNYFAINADYTEEIAPESYHVDSQDAINFASLGENPGDRIEFDSLTFINFEGDATSTFQYNFGVSLLEASGITYTVVGPIEIYNSEHTLSSSPDFYMYNLGDLDTEKGQVEFDSQEAFGVTSGDVLSFDSLYGDFTVNAGEDLSLSATDSIDINSNDAVVIKAGDTLSIGSSTLSLIASAVNQFYLYNELAPRDVHSGEVLLNANRNINFDNNKGPLAFTAFEDMIVESLSSNTFTIGGNWGLTVQDRTSSNSISFGSANNDVTFAVTGVFAWGNSNPDLYSIYDDEQKIITAGDDIFIGTTSTTQISAGSTNKDLEFRAQLISMVDIDGAFAANSGDAIYIETLGAHSNIQTTMSGKVTLKYTLAEFLATDLNLLKATGTAASTGVIDINDLISEYRSYYGDVSILAGVGNTAGTGAATYTSIFDIEVDAYGRNNAKMSAIEINSNTLTSSSSRNTYFRGYQSADFRAFSLTSAAPISFSGFRNFGVESTNYGSDIVSYTAAGPTNFYVATSFVSNSNEALFTSALTSTFSSTAATAFTTAKDLSRFTVETSSENSFVNFVQTRNTNINTDRYSDYKTSDKSDFDGRITVAGSTLLSFQSLRTSASPRFYSKPGVEVRSDEYGIWMHSNASPGTSTVTFSADDVTLDADKQIFVNRPGSVTDSGTFDNSAGTGNTFVRAEGDYILNSPEFNLVADDFVTFETDGLDTENEIVITSQNDVILGSTGGTNIFARGSSTNIEFIADATTSNAVTFTTGNFDWVAEEGIRFLTNNNGGDINFSSEGFFSIVTEDWEDSILVQSDVDVTLTVSGTGEINQLTYNHRLGFFDQEPDFINFINPQALESCVYYGYCGTNVLNGCAYNGFGLGWDYSVCNAWRGFYNIDAYANELQLILMDFGLIEYHHALGGQSFYAALRAVVPIVP